ncbi:hypothetical protein JW998_09040 [candidate division KSB1 bacterium]|nr:hypothetical protein [candidate division KSB1 bacterium]
MTPNPGGEYNWSTPEGSGVVFVLEDGATTRVATGQNVTVKGLSSTGVDGASVSVSFSSNEDDLGRTVGLSDTIIFTVPSISIGGGMELCKGMSETRSVTVTPSGFDHLFSFGVSSSDGGSASVEFDRPSTITVTGSSGGNAIVEAKCEDTVVASFPVVIYEIDISASETSTCEGLTAYIEAEVTPVGSESKFSFDASIPTGVASASWGAEPGTIAVNGGTPGVAVIPISCLGAVVDDITVQVYGITYGPGNPPTTAALSFGGDELPESGGKIYLPFDPAKQNLGQYQRNASGFGGGVGGDMDVRLCQQTIIEDFSDESWLSPDFSAINDQATTTTGIYAATVTFQDNDSPNGTQDGDISRSASVYLVAINIAPEIEYLLMNDTLTMTADVTPEIPGEYYWESLEPDSVLFVTGGGYSSTATGQSVQIIGLNDSSSVDSSVVRAQFQSEEDDTGNSVMIEDTESLTCIYISLASITFNSDHGVMKYAVNYSSEGTDYPYPEWVGSRTVFPSVPISHTRDMYIYITASIVLLPDDLSFPFVLTGQSGKSHLQFSSSGTLGNGGAAISMTSAGKLPNEILPDAGASILWTLTLEDGPTIEPITTGPHEIYVTFGAPVGSYAATNMRMEWSCTQAINAAAIATAAELFCANLASSPGYTGTTLVNSFMININSWEYLDLGSPGDCITLAALACAGLNMLGVGAQYHCSYPTADGSTGYPAVSSTSCHNPTNATFTYQGQDFSARLVYPGNNYEGFFTINDPGIKGYTVYPPRWTFENQDYYYLEVLSSVATDQFWIWDGDQTQNGVSVYNWDVVPGVANIPVPSIPSP